MNPSFSQKKCKPCEGGVDPMSAEEVDVAIKEMPEWSTNDSKAFISRTFLFNNFAEAMAFINRVGEIAEEENHHPDIHLTGYKNVTIELTTHAIQGLSENDFIVAAKVDRL